MQASAHISVNRRPKDGSHGKDGCIYRQGEWASGIEYHNDLEVPKGVKYLDVAIITIGVDQYECYQCLKSHTSSAANRPGTEGGMEFWEKYNSLQPIFTPLIIAQNAVLKFSQTNQLLVMKDDGSTVAAGMGGGQFPLWVGSVSPDEAPFKVSIDGKMIARGAEIIESVLEEVSVSGNLKVRNLGYQINRFKMSANVRVIDCSFITSGEYVLPTLQNGEARSITCFAPIITKSDIGYYFSVEGAGDVMMEAGSGARVEQVTELFGDGLVELVGYGGYSGTTWLYHQLDVRIW